ncbi:MAG: hypothetical protein LBS69_10805 [Prevotellaceae bacterium]|jgi:hypothetical protein|nr:hypothetical protein [Prevotellaceae bacterium]
MKNKIIKTIQLFAIIIISYLCIACPNGSGEKPQCTVTGSDIMPITVQLGYNLNGGNGIDVTYLRSWHYPLFLTNTGTITDLFYLINSSTKTASVSPFFGCSSISVSLSNSICSGNVTYYDDDGSKATALCLYDFPVLSYNSNEPTTMTFKIETVTDYANRSVVWTGTPTIQFGYKITGISSSNGIPKYKGSSGGGSGGGGSSGGTGGDYGGTGPGMGNHHACYLVMENGSYTIAENASSTYDYNSVDWDNVSLISDPNVNTSALSRSVYINGAYNDDVRWNAPYLVLL